MEELFIDVVIYRNGEQWVAQGLQLDILVRAPQPNFLPRLFAQAIDAAKAMSLENGETPFGGIAPAENCYFEMFKASTITVLVEESLHVRIATPEQYRRSR